MQRVGFITSSVIRLGALLSVSVLGAGAAHAQAVDVRWQPWLGCWTENAARATPRAAGADGMVCVVPAPGGEGVQVANIAGGKVERSEFITATGARAPKTVDGCPGWESATWSSDGRRVMLRSEFTCGRTVVKGSTIFGVSAEGEWIEVRGTLVGANSTVVVARYFPAAVTLEPAAAGARSDSMPFAIVPVRGSGSRYARIGAAERVEPEAVLDVARHVDLPVAAAWVNELRQGFTLDAKALVRLADAGLSPDLIDLMVAVSYPKQFAVQRAGPRSGTLGVGATSAGYGAGYPSERRYGNSWNCGYGFVPTTYGYYGDPCYPGFYGYSPYGYGAYGSGYGSYYGSSGGYYWGSRPLLIVPTVSNPSGDVRGKAVNGAGYTRRSGGAAAPAGSSGSSGSVRASGGGSSGAGSTSTGSGSGAGSSTGSSAGSSTSSSDGGRTAKPRVPPG